jgi:hypothetical protein
MALQIKINLPNNSTKTFKFPPDMLISEVVKEIQIKTEIGGADHGLYQRAAKGKKARWLQQNRTLRFYDITSNVFRFFFHMSICSRIFIFFKLSNSSSSMAPIIQSELDFKKKTRPLQIYLADRTLKKILIDDSSLVRDIVKVIVEHLSIHTAPEIWGLRKQDSAESTLLISSNVNKTSNFQFSASLF